MYKQFIYMNTIFFIMIYIIADRVIDKIDYKDFVLYQNITTNIIIVLNQYNSITASSIFFLFLGVDSVFLHFTIIEFQGG